jgi:hypothetical protein
MVTLQPIFHVLGYRSEVQQRSLIKLLEVSGAFGELPGVDGTLNDRQAQAILTSVTFSDAVAAAHWLHDTTQEHMLRRPPGVERHECEEPEHFRRHRGELLNALRRFGALSEAKPKAKHYDHVLVLGAIESAVTARLVTLKELYGQGVRFDNIHLLGSERPLDPRYEPLATIAVEGGAKCSTEMQMMIARAYETNETWPEDLQEVHFTSVTTPTQVHGRANTRDTIVSWLKTKPKPGRVLVISSQPLVGYQDAAVKSMLPAEFTVETVGASIAEDSLKISVAVDSIARQIDVGFLKLLETLTTMQPSLRPVDLANTATDPATYQFRFNADAASRLRACAG